MPPVSAQPPQRHFETKFTRSKALPSSGRLQFPRKNLDPAVRNAPLDRHLLVIVEIAEVHLPLGQDEKIAPVDFSNNEIDWSVLLRLLLRLGGPRFDPAVKGLRPPPVWHVWIDMDRKPLMSAWQHHRLQDESGPLWLPLRAKRLDQQPVAEELTANGGARVMNRATFTNHAMSAQSRTRALDIRHRENLAA
jgi:hypothetical protein